MRYNDLIPSASIDCDMSFGTLSQDRPFIVGLTQALIVLQFFGGQVLIRLFIVLRMLH